MSESMMANSQRVSVFMCRTWEEFIANVGSTEGKLFGSRIYRGQRRVEWMLSSMFERWLWRLKRGNPSRNVREVFSRPETLDLFRDGYLQRFKDSAIGLPGLEGGVLTDEDWWAIGRHHGLITPLLDWTKSPYIAAFFAFVDYADDLNPGFKQGLMEGGIMFGSDPVAVWAIVLTDNLEVEAEFELVRPRVGFSQYSQWMRAQQSVLTRLTHDVHVDLENYLVSRGLGNRLERYEIHGQAMGKALADLNLMNINFASLFPELKGAAAQANIWSSFDYLGR